MANNAIDEEKKPRLVKVWAIFQIFRLNLTIFLGKTQRHEKV